MASLTISNFSLCRGCAVIVGFQHQSVICLGGFFQKNSGLKSEHVIVKWVAFTLEFYGILLIDFDVFVVIIRSCSN